MHSIKKFFCYIDIKLKPMGNGKHCPTRKMNKYLLLSLILFFALAIDAQTFVYNGVCYSIKLFTHNVGVADPYQLDFYKGHISIPETVDYEGVTYTVTSIDNNAFGGQEGLLSVTLPNTITTIGDRSFSGCNGLTEFIIPQSVTIIGEEAFCGSNNIKEIFIPKNVTSIGCRAFSNLEQLVLEDGAKPLKLITFNKINDNTPFHICPLNSIYLGRNLDYQAQYAPFRDNTKLSNIVIGDSISEIGPYLFNGCTGLEAIDISSNVKTINKYAFKGCTGLTRITIPNSVDYLGLNVFCECNIKDLVIEDGENAITFESFLHSPFSFCPSEKIYVGRDLIGKSFNSEVPFTTSAEVVFGNYVTTINDNLFKNCVGLSKIEIGTNVSNIGNESFGGCNSLNVVYCSASNVPITSINAFNNTPISQVCLYVPDSSIEQYKSIKPWSDFKSIKGTAEDSVDLIPSDDEFVETYFNLSGTLKNYPSQGVNIIRTNKGNYKKILIK